MALLLVVVGAALWRLHGLTARGLTSDEAVYLGQGAALTPGSAWSPVRAHPPLLGLLLRLLPEGTSGDLVARVVSVVVGLVAVVVAGLLARELAGRAAGAVAVVVLATMPYHRDVTRLALVEVPMATAVAFALLLVVRAVRQGRPRLVEGAAALLGVATLFKETAVLSVAAVAVALASATPRLPRGVALRALGYYVAVVAAYPVYLWLQGGGGTALDYLGWQVGRPPNTVASFYLLAVVPRIGPVVLVAAAVGAVVLLRRRAAGAGVVVLAVVLPLAFYASWPVRGYPYLLAVTVPLAALGGAGVVVIGRSLARWGRVVPVTVLAGVVLGVGATTSFAGPPELPGATGVPGLRETAAWVADRPVAPVVTAGPWVANVLRHYLPDADVAPLASAEKAGAQTNPAYRRGARAVLPSGRVTVVWDAWTAAADPRTTARLLELVRARDGRVAHVEVWTGEEGPKVIVVAFVLET